METSAGKIDESPEQETASSGISEASVDQDETQVVESHVKAQPVGEVAQNLTEAPTSSQDESESDLQKKAKAEQLEQLEKVQRDYSYQIDKEVVVAKSEQDEEKLSTEMEETTEKNPNVLNSEENSLESFLAPPVETLEATLDPIGTLVSTPLEPSETAVQSAIDPTETPSSKLPEVEEITCKAASECIFTDDKKESSTEKEENKELELIPEAAASEKTPTKSAAATPAVIEDKPASSEVKTASKKEQYPSELDTPSLMSIINTLSPEKLEEIKAQVLALSKSPEKTKAATVTVEETKEIAQETPMSSAEADKMEVVAVVASEETTEKIPESNAEQQAVAKAGECIILLDTDEDEPPAPASVRPETPLAATHKDPEPETTKFQSVENGNSAKIEEETQNSISVPSGAITKRKIYDGKENKPHKFMKQSKECVNPECPRKCDEFEEAPRLILAFYYVQAKLNKTQFACADCFEVAVSGYEKMGEAMLNNLSIADIKVPPKQEMFEIIDSDDEEDTQTLAVPDSQKIIFNKELEDEVESILNDFCHKIDFRKQMKCINEDFESRILEIEIDNLRTEEELKQLERSSLKMYNELYSINKPKVQRRLSIDADKESSPAGRTSLKSMLLTNMQQRTQKILPKNTFISISMPSPGTSSSASVVVDPAEKYYHAIRSRGEVKMHWAPCKLLETKVAADGKKIFKVEFIDNMPNKVANVLGKDLAQNVTNTNLKVGARVVARFFTRTKVGKCAKGRFLPGVVGEKLSAYNKQRYLVFCDYGQVQYVAPADVREIAEASKNVWQDVHVNLRQFIQDYLQSKTSRQRPLLNVRINQRVPTERNGKWHSNALVTDIDASLVKMHFSEGEVYEWLYRGSKRLGPLYSQGQRENLNARRNDPSISYITIEDDDESAKTDVEAETEEGTKKNTARKSTAPSLAKESMPAPAAPPAAQKKAIVLNDSFYYLDEPKEIMKRRNFTPRKDIFAKKYVTHNCSPTCLEKNVFLASHTPLSKPLLTYWERQIIRQKTSRWIVYKAPCGRVLRNMNEVHRFLKLSSSVLNVDNFDFDINIQVLSTFDVIDPKECPLYIPDMSGGKEGMKIPIVNAYDDVRPPELTYSEKRIPKQGVNINTDPAFMACCDCTDDCADKSKCACFQLTIRGFQFAHRGEGYNDMNVSYMWKRLHQQVSTGIYECHDGCACHETKQRCLNRVVQHPISIKMLLYRTPRKGWGLQTCHDIPKGTFICIYAGYLYREDDANALCKDQDHGDEYFAELDLIETAAPLKEGFESGVIMDSDSDDEKDTDSDYNDNDEGDEEFKSTAKSGNRDIVTRSGRNKRSTSKKQSNVAQDGNGNDSDSDSDETMVNMEPTTEKNIEEVQPRGARGLRKLYGKNEKVFVMDAKTCGNVGRYFNHSCDPNMIVQSVFVDTHDMRFPWIAFFSCRIVKAGEELTWNYNYQVGSVPSKVLFCHCGTKKCNGRIL